MRPSGPALGSTQRSLKLVPRHSQRQSGRGVALGSTQNSLKCVPRHSQRQSGRGVALGSTQPSLKWVPRHSQGQSGRCVALTNPPFPSNAEVKKEYRYTSAPLLCLHAVLYGASYPYFTSYPYFRTKTHKHKYVRSYTCHYLA